jgi:hypothetical protein
MKTYESRPCIEILDERNCPSITSLIGSLAGPIILEASPSAAASDAALLPGDTIALNPQPLPPGRFLDGIVSNVFDAVGLNPQPLPPGRFLDDVVGNVFDAVGLNPQPPPPEPPVDQPPEQQVT